MDSLAYLYSALAYEDSSVSAFQFNWRHFSNKIALWLLSVLTTLAIGNLQSPVFAQFLYRTLEFGQSGSDVELVQRCLLELGYFEGQITARFDESTRDAVRAFKFANRDRLSVNDTVDQETAAFLLTGCPQVTQSAVRDRVVISPTPLPSIPPPPPNFTGSFDSILQRGSEGPDVTRLQILLTDAGFDTRGIDGVFGSNTQAALVDLQQAYGLPQTGNYDRATQQVLERGGQVFNPPVSTRTLQPGDRGVEVSNLQTRLRDVGFNPGPIDSIYGAQTEEAVRQYQLAFNIRPADGIARSETIISLGGGDGIPERPGRGPQRYIVVVPGRSSDRLIRVRTIFPDARIFADRRGSYIYAGGYQNRNEAESLSFLLKARGLNARVDYMPDPIISLGLR